MTIKVQDSALVKRLNLFPEDVGKFCNIIAVGFHVQCQRKCFHVCRSKNRRRFRHMDKRPDKSPEPIAVGACDSTVAVPVTSRRWLSFPR
jgi:hypothetical protein